jgi:sigma-B regulation protein RsbU (phosphoserine phosphatase)
MAIFLRPNPSSRTPVYLQLMEQVKDALETGALRPGEPLPDVNRLAQELVINPNAVARAYCELERERVITLRHGVAVGLALAHQFTDRSRVGLAERFARELVLENKRLTAQIAAEVAIRVQSNRELDLAREVQQRLFPQAHPPIAGLDYAGVCRPAHGIGGDYYDFIPLSATRLGIAIADVSGKGISAALLMATVRAHLRDQTSHGVTDLAAMMATLNRLVYESSSANRYASFFYGQYDALTRRLDYVNAGHNPPILSNQNDRVERGERSVRRLDPSGPVIGLIPDGSYVQRSVTLEEGDVLLLFTDGVSETLNAAGEEWGEARLTQEIVAHRALPARELVDRIMRTSEEFAGSAAQYDDMTLVAARVTSHGACRVVA